MPSPAIDPQWESIPAEVPGNVELDLMRAGHLPCDLDKGNQIYLLRPFEKYQWWYSREFDWQPTEEAADAESSRVQLVFEGIDTLGTFWLNGAAIGQTENMLIPHRFDVTDLLVTGTNTIIVALDSAVISAYKEKILPGERAIPCNWESLHIRKAAHCYGWDILPRAVTSGLWRDVYLETVPPVRFENVYCATKSIDRTTSSACLSLNWDIQAPDHTDTDSWNIDLSLSTHDDSCPFFKETIPVLCRHGYHDAKVSNIEFWWPRGFGKAPLYQLTLTLSNGEGRTLATHNLRIGIRTIKLDRTDILAPDGSGRFCFVVNGEDIFVKGTNWVPLDIFHSRDAQWLQSTLDAVCDLNCNTLRCWGGGVYETAAFFQRCDEEGILVWQDFALGCALYPQTAAFHEKMRIEAETVVALLRNHPSLALWAGNNEIDQFYQMWLPQVDPNIADRLSREVLATACRQLDPWRDYLPSSPYFSPALFAADNALDRRPEDHLWGPRDDFKGPYYTTSPTLFASETGYHGMPARSSMERMMNADQLWPWKDNEEWLTHAVRPLPRATQFNYRIPLMAHQIEVLFQNVPDNLDDYITASQISQAEALKFFIERFRIAKGQRSGILWWNLRDGWPVISDAVLDYYGNRKIAYEVIRRLQKDICVMLDEPVNGKHRVVAVNDTASSQPLTAKVMHAGTLLLQSTLTLEPNSACTLGFVPASPTATLYTLSWEYEGCCPNSSCGLNHYLAGPRPFNLQDCIKQYESLKLLPVDSQ